MPKNRILGILKDLSGDAKNALHYWRHNLLSNQWSDLSFSHSKHPPIVLIQGLMGTQGVLQPLANYLKSKERNVITIDLGFFNVRDIRQSAAILNYHLERVMDLYCQSHSFEKMDIVGHSMGGLIGLYYTKKLGGHRLIRKLITLGAPFQGTWASFLGIPAMGAFSKGIWQLVPGSPFLKDLHTHKNELHETQVVSIAAKNDAICPPSSCYLANATNYVLPVGHAALLIDQSVFETVKRFLEAEDPTQKIVNIHQKPKT